jgi:hypothetical protein
VHRFAGHTETTSDQGALTLMSTNEAAIDLRDARLAELVAGLTGCDEHGALHALREDDDHDDALERVANAILLLDQPAPEGFRVAGYLREDRPVTVR